MSLEEICRSFRFQFHAFSAYISEEYQSSPGQDDQAELENRCKWLAAEIRWRAHLAARCHAGLVELQRRLAHHEKECADLLKQARIYHRLGDQANAWNHSLELDQLRQLIIHERSRLKSHEKSYWNQATQVHRLKKRLARICERIARR